jgi:hypothetical protein
MMPARMAMAEVDYVAGEVLEMFMEMMVLTVATIVMIGAGRMEEAEEEDQLQSI